MPDDLSIYVRNVAELQTFTIPLYSAKVSIRAVDASTNKPVKGVKLILRDPQGLVYASWTTSKGWKVFRPIAPGLYMLETKSVPKGYQLPATEQVKIEGVPDMQYFEVKLTRKEKKASNVVGSASAASSGAGRGGSGGGSAASSVGNLPAKTPGTGDDLNMMWIYLALALEAMLIGIFVWRRKRQRK